MEMALISVLINIVIVWQGSHKSVDLYRNLCLGKVLLPWDLFLLILVPSSDMHINTQATNIFAKINIDMQVKFLTPQEHNREMSKHIQFIKHLLTAFFIPNIKSTRAKKINEIWEIWPYTYNPINTYC